MSYIPKTLFSFIEDINDDVFLPHIQRPFVWDEEQMRRLFDSLMQNYPIQTFLTWRTKSEIKVRRFMTSIEWDANLHDYYDLNKSAEGVEKVFVLDGQQRLQTLFVLFNGAIKTDDGKTDLEAYFDLTSGVELDDFDNRYHLTFSEMRLDLPWYRLRDLRGKDALQNANELGDDLNEKLDTIIQGESSEDKKRRERTVRRNIGQLTSLLREEKHFWVQELDGVANNYPYKHVLEIFVRVNSGGTKLDAADLMFAAMKEGWSDVEQNIEELVDFFNDGKLKFDKNLILKCIVVASGFGAELGPERFTSDDGERLLSELEHNWSQHAATFEQLRDFIRNELQLYGNKVVRSYNSFVPIYDYLYWNPKPDELNRQLIRAYYYKSQLFNWYRSQTDNIINTLHRTVGKKRPNGFPIQEIKAYFKSRYDVELKYEHLNDIRLRFILLNLVYVEQFGTSPFNVSFKGNEPHIDHIFPQSALRTQLGLWTSQINTIGNFRFVGATDNIRKRAELPGDYFSRLKTLGLDIHKHLMVENFAQNPRLMSFNTSTYRNFVSERQKKIYEIANRVVNAEMLQ